MSRGTGGQNKLRRNFFKSSSKEAIFHAPDCAAAQYPSEANAPYSPSKVRATHVT
jgi:hypothetical protein